MEFVAEGEERSLEESRPDRSKASVGTGRWVELYCMQVFILNLPDLPDLSFCPTAVNGPGDFANELP